MPRLFRLPFGSTEAQHARWPQHLAALQPYDDDVPLGLECANPVLQIDRWRPDTQEVEAGNVN